MGVCFRGSEVHGCVHKPNVTITSWCNWPCFRGTEVRGCAQKPLEAARCHGDIVFRLRDMQMPPAASVMSVTSTRNHRNVSNMDYSYALAWLCTEARNCDLGARLCIPE